MFFNIFEQFKKNPQAQSNDQSSSLRIFSKLKGRSGQIAYVIMFITAIALIFYAASLNLGRLSRNKSQVIIAADNSTGMLASQMTSYAQKLLYEQLGGSPKVCKSCGFFCGWFFSIFIVVIGILTGGIGLTLAIVTIAINVLAMVIETAVVLPQVDAMWNKMSAASLSTTDQFLEQGIRVGLRNAVSDNVEVPDMIDIDQDRRFGFTGAVPNDKVNRFAYYYTHRLGQVKTNTAPSVLQNFMDALDEFLYQGTDNWGIYDPWKDDPTHPCQYDPNDSNQQPLPAICNQCCVPAQYTDPYNIDPLTGNPAVVTQRPQCCDKTGSGNCGTSTSCRLRSHIPGVPYVYDPYHENANNSFRSLLENIGRDDEHDKFFKNWENPNWNDPAVAGDEISYARQYPMSLISQNDQFWWNDTSGYYDDLRFNTSRMDKKEGMHGYFYKLYDWGLDLTDPQVGKNLATCYMCDPRFDATCSACPNVNLPNTPALFIPALKLPLNPARLRQNKTARVDPPSTSPGGRPLAPDAVVPPATRFVALPDECPDVDLTLNNNSPFWKPGADRFCSQKWPYYLNCPKHRGPSGKGCQPTGSTGFIDCECNDVATNVKQDFNEDVLDAFVYAAPLFISYAEKLLQYNYDDLSMNFDTWYPFIADWIEKKGGNCVTCGPDEGYLWLVLNNMQVVLSRVKSWRDQRFTGATDEVWCGAPDPPGGNLNGPFQKDPLEWGPSAGSGDTLNEIIECLNYNIDGKDTTSSFPYTIKPKNTFEGNDWRFDYCYQTCSQEACSDLPRSLVPNFDPNGYVNIPLQADAQDRLQITACQQTCSNATCQNLPLFQSSTNAPYPYPSPATFDATKHCSYQTANAQDANDLNLMLQCLGDCNNTNCQALPAVRSSTGAPYAYGNPATFDEQSHCGWVISDPADLVLINNCYNSCSDATCQAMPGQNSSGVSYPFPARPSTFNQAVNCDPTTQRPTGLWLNGVQQAISMIYASSQAVPVAPWDAGIKNSINTISSNPQLKGQWASGVAAALNQIGSCDYSPGGWLDTVRQSRDEATNQVAKFYQRRELLQSLRDDADHIIQTFTNAVIKFQNFLNGPANDLINLRKAWSGGPTAPPLVQPPLEYHSVYGWKTEPNDGSQGLWHIVKAEARLPRRCDDGCGPNQSSPDSDWPRIKSKTSKGLFGGSTCYQLINTEGSVKSRITRWDEPMDSRNKLFFPKGQELWTFRSSRNKTGLTGTNLATLCPPIADPSVLTPQNGSNIFAGAFILNSRRDNPGCWDEVHKLLLEGYSFESCADYYYEDAGGAQGENTMKFDIRPCNTF